MGHVSRLSFVTRRHRTEICEFEIWSESLQLTTTNTWPPDKEYLYYISKYKSIFRTIGGRRATNVTGWLLQIGAKWWDREVPFWHFFGSVPLIRLLYSSNTMILVPCKKLFEKTVWHTWLYSLLLWYCVLQSGGYYALEWPSRITTLVREATSSDIVRQPPYLMLLVRIPVQVPASRAISDQRTTAYCTIRHCTRSTLPVESVEYS